MASLDSDSLYERSLAILVAQTQNGLQNPRHYPYLSGRNLHGPMGDFGFYDLLVGLRLREMPWGNNGPWKTRLDERRGDRP
jgi:hypothetical protein